jgi:hypothetical protein
LIALRASSLIVPILGAVHDGDVLVAGVL